MNTFRPSATPTATSSGRLIFALTVLVISLGLGIPGTARAVDNIGIFWDTAYTEDTTTVDTFPGFLTGYLVLMDPSTTAGILGWELCVDVDGPAQFISWALAGQGINASSPPCFAVGIAPVPLPSVGDALLATFQIMVTEALPVALSVRPDYRPSVPDQMTYIPADDPSALLPMTTLTGQPEVAWINDHIPNLEVSPATLHFDNTVIGTTNHQFVTVTNSGLIPGYLDVALTGDCGPYSLPGLSGAVTVAAGSAVAIEVAFTPTTTDAIFCNLALGADLAEVQMVGSGLVVDAEWEATTEIDFGSLGLGTSIQRLATIRNIGTIPFDIDPSIPASCPEFTITSGNWPSTLWPGSQRSITVRFEPSAVASFTCQLDLGNVVPAVTLRGSGRDPSYDWNLWPTILDFGTVGIGYTQTMIVNISNTGGIPLPVAPAVPAGCPEFTIIGGGGSTLISPGATHHVTVEYAPTSVTQDFCTLDLGDVVPDVPMTGVGRVAVLSWLAPTSHDFGNISVGQVGAFTFSVFNSGDVPFEVAPDLPDTTTNFHLFQGSTVTLLPGMSTTITVQFKPLVDGAHSVALDLGTTVPAVQLQGIGDPLPPGWVVSPALLDFGWVYVGSYQELDLAITNTGGTFLDLDINLADSGLGFSIVTGGGVFQLAPGSIHNVRVRFQPQVDGTFTTDLNLGTLVPAVPLTGAGETTDDICLIHPDSLIFGPLNLGSTQTKTVAVTNNGNQSIDLWPGTNSPLFISTGSSRTLGPGQTAYYSVIFQPTTPGTFTGTLDFGNQVCAGVPLVGTADVAGGVGNNLVGIFFDPAYSTIEAQTFTSNEIVVGYLVLTEPSEPTGVSAWELKADIDGDAQWLQWILEGQHINVGQGSEFIVGIGGTPLPPSPTILLATFQILVAEPYPSVVYLELGPIQFPSLPNQMVWAPGHDSSMLLPMHSLTGQPVVAGINWGPVVGIGNPAPRAILTGGAVELEWPVPEGQPEGCHVYRRETSGTATRLTDQPVTGFGAALTYTDRPTGYASGTVLHYSYTVVQGGVEGPRSPETEVRLTGLPAVLTRLLPNVPNPFNPQTEIRFELARSQQVQVSVYDVTGRLVKVLVDGQLGSGSHMRVWQGRDSGGRQVPSGAYYVRLAADGRIDHRKIMLLK